MLVFPTKLLWLISCARPSWPLARRRSPWSRSAQCPERGESRVWRVDAGKRTASVLSLGRQHEGQPHSGRGLAARRGRSAAFRSLLVHLSSRFFSPHNSILHNPVSTLDEPAHFFAHGAKSRVLIRRATESCQEFNSVWLSPILGRAVSKKLPALLPISSSFRDTTLFAHPHQHPLSFSFSTVRFGARAHLQSAPTFSSVVAIRKTASVIAQSD